MGEVNHNFDYIFRSKRNIKNTQAFQSAMEDEIDITNSVSYQKFIKEDMNKRKDP